jgi:hypothetical protein
MNATEEEFRRALAADAGVSYVPGIATMTERDLSSRVHKMVNERQLRGFCIYDFRKRSAPGWVDWVILGPGGALFRELKGRNGVLTRDQRIVGMLLRRAGCDWDVWGLPQLGNGTIARELDALTMQCPPRTAGASE